MKKLTTILLISVMTVFNLCNQCKAQYTKLFDFSNSLSGSDPMGGLTSDGTFLYGMAQLGGTNNGGVIFKINPDGTGYTKLFDFPQGVSWDRPYGTLIIDGNFLYGMTSEGGNGMGSVFKIQIDGTNYSEILNFTGSINGRNPYGDLIFDGTFLYGMTSGGGIVDSGTVFKIKTDGTGYVKLLDFTGIANGDSPYGSLISDGNFLYGMTPNGGTNGMGVIFKIKLDGTGFYKLLDFAGAANGGTPLGSLAFDGTFLYGMTERGGGTGISCGGMGCGVFFKIKPDGTEYSKLLEFVDTISRSGIQPYASLTIDATFLYGMTPYGGTNANGQIFKIETDGTGYEEIFAFENPTTGVTPYGSLISDGIFLYGMTLFGGTNYDGVIFKNCVSHYTTSYDTLQNIFNLNVDSIITALATGYHWSFGDGSSSTLATSSHTYTDDSIYNVCMKIYLASGDSCIYCHNIGKDSLGNISRDGGFTINIGNANTPADVSENLVKESNIAVFPNPTNGIFVVTNTSYKISCIEAYNVLGECILQQMGTFINFQIDLSNKPNGIYILKIKTEKGILSKKLIISK